MASPLGTSSRKEVYTLVQTVSLLERCRLSPSERGITVENRPFRQLSAGRHIVGENAIFRQLCARRDSLSFFPDSISKRNTAHDEDHKHNGCPDVVSLAGLDGQ